MLLFLLVYIVLKLHNRIVTGPSRLIYINSEILEFTDAKKFFSIYKRMLAKNSSQYINVC